MLKPYGHILTLLLVVVLTGVTTVPGDEGTPASSASSKLPGDKYNIFKQNAWADSVLAQMTPEEKIGQLFMVAAFTSKDRVNVAELRSLVENHHIGGVIFFKGGPGREVNLTNYLQEKSKFPLIIGMDAEWGLAMRLDSTLNFGYQMPLGAASDDSLAYRLGQEMAYQIKRIGAHINFAPVVDINNNPLNPVIHMRSFGENKDLVARRSLLYMQGMQDGHVLAVAKHFPGHGNTAVDSHFDLPVSTQSAKNLDTLELYPFKKLFAAGVGGVMTAHLQVPSLDNTPHVGASLSPAVTTGLLRFGMKYNGLAFSDALNMGGVTRFYGPGEIALKALLAGNDVLVYSEDVPKAISFLKNAVDSGCISQSFIDDRVRRILQVKSWVGLQKCRYTQVDEVVLDLNRPSASLLKSEIAGASVTIVRNEGGLIPLKNLSTLKIANVQVGSTSGITQFGSTLSRYAPVASFNAPMLGTEASWNKLSDTLTNYNMVIVSLHYLSNKNTGSYGLSAKAIEFVTTLSARQKVILVNMGSPYAFNRFPDAKWAMCGYQDDWAYGHATAQALMGGASASGHLPVTPGSGYSYGGGVLLPKPIRLAYNQAESVGMSSYALNVIDSMAMGGIRDHLYPGCQVFVARNGTVVLNKAFGKHTYDDHALPVTTNDIYDLASLTKAASTTLAVMKLYETGKLDLNKSLGYYLPELRTTNKADLNIKDVMAHQAGLQAFIPFYTKTLTIAGQCDSSLYCAIPMAGRDTRVAQNLYLRNAYRDTLFNLMDKSPLTAKGEMVYSDLGFLYMGRIVQKLAQMPIDSFMAKHFYDPLGLSTLGFKPRERFDLSRLVPTEEDRYFRQQLLHGDVHDPTAAMLGGVAGHAGLFGNANDLGILLQMLLQEGTYGGNRYLLKTTVNLFTSSIFPNNRRGLGFDKPPAVIGASSPAASATSSKAFGHTGFTGTYIWADPQEDLVFIFLSNRVNPDATENRLAKSNLRTLMHQAAYRAIVYKN